MDREKVVAVCSGGFDSIIMLNDLVRNPAYIVHLWSNPKMTYDRLPSETENASAKTVFRLKWHPNRFVP